MPLHDWTDERGWDSVHPFWLAYLVEWVQPRLPEGYKAFLGGVPSLTVGSGNGKPDVSVRQWKPPPAAEAAGTDTTVLEPDLEASVAFRLDLARVDRRRSRQCRGAHHLDRIGVRQPAHDPQWFPAQ